MKIIKKELSALKHPDSNVRMHTDKQIAEFKRSVEMFGQIRPIVCDENGVILAGNGLYETLLTLGKTDAECYVVTGLSENEKKKLMLADNRIFDLGVDDMKVFDEIIASLGDDLDVPGYDEELLQTLVAEADDIDEMMSDYGLITDVQKESIEKHAKTIENEDVSPQQKADTMAAMSVDELPKEPVGKYVICPKCGEKIWL